MEASPVTPYEIAWSHRAPRNDFTTQLLLIYSKKFYKEAKIKIRLCGKLRRNFDLITVCKTLPKSGNRFRNTRPIIRVRVDSVFLWWGKCLKILF
jgi:hypothetical protein